MIPEATVTRANNVVATVVRTNKVTAEVTPVPYDRTHFVANFVENDGTEILLNDGSNFELNHA